jgi:hypothetical protein
MDIQTEKARINTVAEQAKQNLNSGVAALSQYNDETRKARTVELRQEANEPLNSMVAGYQRTIEQHTAEIATLTAYEPLDNLSIVEYQKLSSMPVIVAEVARLDEIGKRKRWQAVKANGSEALRGMYAVALGISYSPHDGKIEELNASIKSNKHAEALAKSAIRRSEENRKSTFNF